MVLCLWQPYEPVVKGLELHDRLYDIAIHIVRLQGAPLVS